jgi:hypothetical protein
MAIPGGNRDALGKLKPRRGHPLSVEPSGGETSQRTVTTSSVQMLASVCRRGNRCSADAYLYDCPKDPLALGEEAKSASFITSEEDLIRRLTPSTLVGIPISPCKSWDCYGAPVVSPPRSAPVGRMRVVAGENGRSLVRRLCLALKMAGDCATLAACTPIP